MMASPGFCIGTAGLPSSQRSQLPTRATLGLPEDEPPTPLLALVLRIATSCLDCLMSSWPNAWDSKLSTTFEVLKGTYSRGQKASFGGVAGGVTGALAPVPGKKVASHGHP